MRIVYDKTQTMEKGLSGWSESLCFLRENNQISASETSLWRCLAPEEISPHVQLVDSKCFNPTWDTVFLVGEARESQYDVLRRSGSGSERRQACIALSGQGFHGQRQRSWQALPGNLHLSMSVPLNLKSGPEGLAWTMLPAVAVMRALKDLEIPGHLGIKWVNDVLCGPRKLAGVISALNIAEGRINRGFLGIGLNVAQAPSISSETDCLQGLLPSQKIELGRVLQAVLAAVADLIQVFEDGQDSSIFHEYQKNSLIVGREVRLMTDPKDGKPSEICRGKVIQINPDLSLNIEGQRNPIGHGRLSFLK